MASAIWERVQESCSSLKRKMGGLLISSARQQQLQQQHGRQVSITCDDCGRIFSVSADFSASDKKKRCDRCAARVTEEKVAQSPHGRQCAGCQMIFNVSSKVAEFPSSMAVNCQRCSDTRRHLIQKGVYVEATIQKGVERFYICCPRAMSSEMKKCLQYNYKERNGYSMLPE